MSRQPRKPRIITTTMEKLVFGGQALGHQEDKAIFAWNALPGETVDVQLTKQKSKWVEGTAINISNPSSDRIPPREGHYLSCSPWQILKPEAELKWKKQTAIDTFRKLGKFEPDPDLQIVNQDNNLYHYRNKIEYSFVLDHDGQNRLAFFKRGTRGKQPIDPCVLADAQINQTAQQILDWANSEQIPTNYLKSIIIRSDTHNRSAAALFINRELALNNFLKLDDKFVGFDLYYTDPRCPASRPDKLLHSQGQSELTIQVRTAKLTFGLLSFFQVNVPAFEQSLKDIEHYLDPSKPAVDFFSGVGAISLPLSKKFSSCTLVDNNAEAIEFAQRNIKQNSIANCEAVLSPAEKITDLITSDKIIIFDPPRAGLHPDIIDRALSQKPPRLVYLSCNISTQARDIELLSQEYEVKLLKLYNFFPRTPHIEALCILELK